MSRKDFIVYSDTAHNDLGCVLMQEGKVVLPMYRDNWNGTRRITPTMTWSSQLLSESQILTNTKGA